MMLEMLAPASRCESAEAVCPSVFKHKTHLQLKLGSQKKTSWFPIKVPKLRIVWISAHAVARGHPFISLKHRKWDLSQWKSTYLPSTRPCIWSLELEIYKVITTKINTVLNTIAYPSGSYFDPALVKTPWVSSMIFVVFTCQILIMGYVDKWDHISPHWGMQKEKRTCQRHRYRSLGDLGRGRSPFIHSLQSPWTGR